jgi:hypothetical protein
MVVRAVLGVGDAQEAHGHGTEHRATYETIGKRHEELLVTRDVDTKGTKEGGWDIGLRPASIREGCRATVGQVRGLKAPVVWLRVSIRPRREMAGFGGTIS